MNRPDPPPHWTPISSRSACLAADSRPISYVLLMTVTFGPRIPLADPHIAVGWKKSPTKLRSPNSLSGRFLAMSMKEISPTSLPDSRTGIRRT
jgi:hypothetical protein